MPTPEKDGIKIPDLDEHEMLYNFSPEFSNPIMISGWKFFKIKLQHPLTANLKKDQVVTLDFPTLKFAEKLAKDLPKQVEKWKKAKNRVDGAVFQLIFTGNFVEG